MHIAIEAAGDLHHDVYQPLIAIFRLAKEESKWLHNILECLTLHLHPL
jgi:hypothetical protein